MENGELLRHSLILHSPFSFFSLNIFGCFAEPCGHNILHSPFSILLISFRCFKHCCQDAKQRNSIAAQAGVLSLVQLAHVL